MGLHHQKSQRPLSSSQVGTDAAILQSSKVMHQRYANMSCMHMQPPRSEGHPGPDAPEDSHVRGEGPSCQSHSPGRSDAEQRKFAGLPLPAAAGALSTSLAPTATAAAAQGPFRASRPPQDVRDTYQSPYMMATFLSSMQGSKPLPRGHPLPCKP